MGIDEHRMASAWSPRALAGVLALALCGAGAHEAEAQIAGWYLGAAGGVAMTDGWQDFSDRTCNTLLSTDPLFTSCTYQLDESGIAYKFFGGIRLTRNLGVEAGYAHLGTGGSDVDFVFDDEGWGNPSSQRMAAFYAALVARADVTERVGLHAKVGAQRWKADFDSSIQPPASVSPPTFAHQSNDGVNLMFGAGVTVSVTELVDVQLEWERFLGVGRPSTNHPTTDLNVDLISVGARLKF